MKILPFISNHTQELKRLGQSLRNHIVSCETRDDDLIVYNTDHEMDEYITDFQAGKNIILLAQENDDIIGYGIGKIKTEDWEGTQIKTIGQIEQLFVSEVTRGKGVGNTLIQQFEQVFKQKGVLYIEISVFALNTGAYTFYKKYGFEERLITLDKKILK